MLMAEKSEVSKAKVVELETPTDEERVLVMQRPPTREPLEQVSQT